jgi:hypothetical protein
MKALAKHRESNARCVKNTLVRHRKFGNVDVARSESAEKLTDVENDIELPPNAAVDGL